jgi:protein involved in polysaccharide export with SLBB domain
VPLVDELQRSIYLVGAIAGTKTTDEATAMQRMHFEQGDTVRTVLERAGGVGQGADLKAAHIARRRPGDSRSATPAVIPVDLEALLVRREFSADVKLEIGDVLTVPFRRYGVSVQGAVMRPGVFQFNPTLSINEYLAHAGGPTKMAKSQGDIRVVTTTGKVKPFKDKPVVEPGDTIVVPERVFSPGEIVQIVVAAASLIIGSVALALAARK